MPSLLEYLDAAGRSPFRDWFDALDPTAAAKVTTALARMEQGNFAHAKGVGEGVQEYRIDFGPGYRVYFGRDGGTLVILLGGGTKRRQQRDIQDARALLGRTTSIANDSLEEALALTRHFKETVAARVGRDPAFREALLREGIETLLAGDVGTGKAVLRDYINATMGFEALATATGISAKSLMRMFGPNGNPQAQNLFAVLGHLQKHANLRMELSAVRGRRTRKGAARAGPRA